MGSTTEEKPRKEDGKIFDIIEKLARVETLLESFNKTNEKDHDIIKEGLAGVIKDIIDQDKRLDMLEKEMVTFRAACDKKFNDVVLASEKSKLAYDRMKWLWGAIAFVITPIITAIILYVINLIWGL